MTREEFLTSALERRDRRRARKLMNDYWPGVPRGSNLELAIAAALKREREEALKTACIHNEAIGSDGEGLGYCIDCGLGKGRKGKS